MLRQNFVPAISIEGFEEATDYRRGKGTYQKVKRAMRILKERKLLFGASCCYTSKNIDSLSSEEYIDMLIESGAKFAWFFHYMPVGNTAVPELLPSPEQREIMYHKIREYRNSKPIFTIDFQHDGEFVKGCIAGGRSYLHINANGDIEPCAFIHYADSNIRQHSLLEAYKRPLFMAYKEGQPFMTICSVLVPCWKIRSVCATWSSVPAPVQPIWNLLKTLTICMPSASHMQSTGLPKLTNSGLQAAVIKANKIHCSPETNKSQSLGVRFS